MSIWEDQHWYAVRTRSNFEWRVTAELSAKGVECFLPSVRQIRQWKDRRKEIDQPLFSGYVFSRFAGNAQSRVRILSTTGAVSILGTGSQIEPIPDREIDQIRTMLAAKVNCFAHPFLQEGCCVRVRRGPLKGLSGLLDRFKNNTRLVLSVSLLSQSVAAEVDISDVEYVGQAASPQPAFSQSVAWATP
ncbi:MAG TPA: UpxY family transcription antiterminator [Bryobacteraceae bacterium]|nr:UpxY family transcription antiterminator [Bryobacteraceae bacterium]